MGQLGEAILMYRKAIEVNPNDSRYHYNMGTTLQKNKKTKEAIACYTQSIALDPDFPSAHFAQGNALISLDMTEPALKSY
jgi:tetratricopeptide (TPR) repeat protein